MSVINRFFGLSFKISGRLEAFFKSPDDAVGKLVMVCPFLFTVWIDFNSVLWFSNNAWRTFLLGYDSKSADDVLRFASIFFRSCSIPLADSLTKKSCCLLKAFAVFLVMMFRLIMAIIRIAVIKRAVVVQIITEDEKVFFIYVFQSNPSSGKEGFY